MRAELRYTWRAGEMATIPMRGNENSMTAFFNAALQGYDPHEG